MHFMVMELTMTGVMIGCASKTLLPMNLSTTTSLYEDYSVIKRNFSQWIQIFSATNNTECAKLLEEIKCAQCSPHAQYLFHFPDRQGAPDNELAFPVLCRDYCKQLYFACRSQMTGLFQTTSDEFCNLYAAKDNGICFPDSPRKQVQGPDSNYLNQMDDYYKMEQINRFNKITTIWFRKTSICSCDVESATRRAAR
ncbi:hedgehog-interacting protein-like isoform X2 [Hypanus sabinus]|uniref:hedgehog-interacting protein-like isoform X2 n=1 Tax=Hypanus sabinus TaxID=79690 RepID=UPI0028C3EC95|nr:hedgehog-interacting protein-like isoform X2 [Hypanus sabinus]